MCSMFRYGLPRACEQWAPFPLALHDGKLQMALRLLWLFEREGRGATKIGDYAIAKQWVKGYPFSGRNMCTLLTSRLLDPTVEVHDICFLFLFVLTITAGHYCWRPWLWQWRGTWHLIGNCVHELQLRNFNLWLTNVVNKIILFLLSVVKD